jgi:flagellin-like hook-associated protein FlgL
MKISTYAQSLMVQQRTETLQSRLFKANEQLASGKKAAQFSELRAETSQTLTLRTTIQTVVQYTQTIDISGRRMDVMHDSLERTNGIAKDVATEALTGLYDNELKLPYLQQVATTRADEMITLMNARFGERYLFAGTESNEAPVADLKRILEGDPSDPAGPRQGLKDLITVRKTVDAALPAADLPAGQWPGHVEVREDGTNLEFRLDDPAFAGFGFSLSSLRYDQATGGTGVVTPIGVADPPPAGPDTVPAIILDTSTVTFHDEQTFRLILNGPDGQEIEIALTATDDISDDRTDRFFMGANPEVALRQAMTQALEEEATTTLVASSAQQAANEFFDHPPRLVRFDAGSGTWGTVEDQAESVVRWYRGETDGDPRTGIRAKVDDGVVMDYGIRADEAPLADSLKQLAVMAATEYDAATSDAFRAMAERSSTLLSDAAERVRGLLGEHGTRMALAQSFKERHEATEALATKQLNDVENASMQEVASRILTLETQLNASFELTSRSQNLNLTRFLR